jgi:hypothetical protein
MSVPPARRLAAALEPVIGSVYFAPECHDAYAALGFSPSPGKVGDVHLPDGPAYFCSRGSCLGEVPGELVAAAFGVFNPAVVVPSVANGREIASAATLAQARVEGVAAQLRRILGQPDDDVATATALLTRAAEPLSMCGRPLFAGLRSLDPVGEPWADLHRRGDLLREFRGDSHTAAWTAAGLTGPEIGLLTEAYWGLPLRSYVRTRAWSDDELDEAHERMQSRGLLDDRALTADGRAFREQLEIETDRQVEPALDALGDDLDRLLGILEPWGRAVRAAGGYLPAGPHDLAAATR